MCNGEGVVEDYMMAPAEYGPGQPSELDRRAKVLQDLLSAGVVDISDPTKQYEILNLLASGNFTIEDITDSPDLTPSLKAAGATQTILVNDGLVKSGRTYAIRAKSQTNVLEKKAMGYALGGTNPHVPPIVPLVLETQTQDSQGSLSRTARWKRFDQLMCTFWTDQARTIPNTVNARIIQLRIVPRFPPKILQPTETLITNLGGGTPTNLPNPDQPAVNTEVMLYQVDATHNPTHQFMSSLLITRNPAVYIPRYYELQLTITLAGGVVGADCFMDAFIMQTVLR